MKLHISIIQQIFIKRYVPGIFLGTRDASLNKKKLCPNENPIALRKQKINR